MAMIKKYWFGPGCIEKDYLIFNDHEKFNIVQMQKELKEADEMIVSFQWNHNTNYIPWEFKMWIDVVVEYGIYNKGLKFNIIIHNGNPTLENYLTSVIQSVKFIKADVNIIWK